MASARLGCLLKSFLGGGGSHSVLTKLTPGGRCAFPVRSPFSVRPPLTGEGARRHVETLAGIGGIYERAREEFAYFEPLRQNPAFMENAGGSQCPLPVAKAVYDYMLHSYVQHGAPYKLSERATRIVNEAHHAMQTYVNGHQVGQVALGASCSQLLAMIATGYGRILKPGDEVVVHTACHESNAGPWVQMAEAAGLSLKFWRVNADDFSSSFDDLQELLTPRTRIVAVTHVSNILGEVLDLERVVRIVKAEAGPKARVVADGVAYAPHRVMDVRAWGVDWYAFSTYKVFGPHLGVLFGTNAAFADLRDVGPNHFFIPGVEVPYKFELGSVPHELCAGVRAMPLYLQTLVSYGSRDVEVVDDPHVGRELVEEAYARMTAMEAPLTETLLSYLVSKPQITVVGPKTTENRVSTFSIVHKSKKSQEVVEALVSQNFAVRYGHMYAYRLIQALSSERLNITDIEDGVARISLVHYNTPKEVDRLISALEKIL